VKQRSMTKREIVTPILAFLSTWAFGQTDFSGISQSTDSTYGYMETNPLRMKKGNVGKSIGYSYDFLQGLRTSDDQKLKFLKRVSIDNPDYRTPRASLTNRYTGMPFSGNGGQLDKYVFLTAGKKDTLTIYIDVYKRGDLKIPVGLKYE
jgi:hypothetical protein